MEVITLNKEAFLKESSELISKIDGFSPDIIVVVQNAGVYLGDELKKNQKFRKVSYGKIKVQRENEFIKRSLFFNLVIKFFSYNALNTLRKYESKNAKESIKKLDLNSLLKKKIEIKGHFKKAVKNILIVDDAIDTGRTMFLVKSNLEKQFPNTNTKIAVLSWTIESSIVKPDFYIYKNILVRFPWSKDYKGKDFEK